MHGLREISDEGNRVSGEQADFRWEWWRQRCGHIVKVRVWGDNSTATCPLQDALGKTYSRCGEFSLVRESDQDLVEFLGEEIEVRRVR